LGKNRIKSAFLNLLMSTSTSTTTDLTSAAMASSMDEFDLGEITEAADMRFSLLPPPPDVGDLEISLPLNDQSVLPPFDINSAAARDGSGLRYIDEEDEDGEGNEHFLPPAPTASRQLGRKSPNYLKNIHFN
jgi:hypothetical protein